MRGYWEIMEIPDVAALIRATLAPGASRHFARPEAENDDGESHARVKSQVPFLPLTSSFYR
jgi:hypothetical protein